MVTNKLSSFYKKENFLRVLALLALLIATFSIWYTNELVKRLEFREKQQVDLYAKVSKEIYAAPMDEDVTLLTEILGTNNFVPMIVSNEDGTPTQHRNVQIPEGLTEKQELAFLKDKMEEMKEEYEPLEVSLGDNWHQYIYYTNSLILKQIRYYPYVQISTIAVLAILAYLVFVSVKKAEQNKLWAGLAKETAHQLGTPISSLLAWNELLRSNEDTPQEIIEEIDKDIVRLQVVTSRFSNIGSASKLTANNIFEIVKEVVEYLEKRVSSKVIFNITAKSGQNFETQSNAALFSWVIENVCKNAVDAMEGKGKIDIYLRCSTHKKQNVILIDIKDTGKGISKSKIKEIFKPGFTTKKRGWGIGLSLAKRIIEEFHQGKIFVLKSEINQGTTFRVILPQLMV